MIAPQFHGLQSSLEVCCEGPCLIKDKFSDSDPHDGGGIFLTCEVGLTIYSLPALFIFQSGDQLAHTNSTF